MPAQHGAGSPPVHGSPEHVSRSAEGAHGFKTVDAGRASAAETTPRSRQHLDAQIQQLKAAYIANKITVQQFQSMLETLTAQAEQGLPFTAGLVAESSSDSLAELDPQSQKLHTLLQSPEKPTTSGRPRPSPVHRSAERPRSSHKEPQPTAPVILDLPGLQLGPHHSEELLNIENHQQLLRNQLAALVQEQQQEMTRKQQAMQQALQQLDAFKQQQHERFQQHVQQLQQQYQQQVQQLEADFQAQVEELKRDLAGQIEDERAACEQAIEAKRSDSDASDASMHEDAAGPSVTRTHHGAYETAPPSPASRLSQPAMRRQAQSASRPAGAARRLHYGRGVADEAASDSGHDSVDDEVAPHLQTPSRSAPTMPQAPLSTVPANLRRSPLKSAFREYRPCNCRATFGIPTSLRTFRAADLLDSDDDSES
ncbi:hypothetical protein WJX72_002693 [[Myrmecia] bisecta]|uniref:Uncharacterized protein n=1 Tax=[Myrmecia] bisecta TaxID=41462 RepID=A0AAW1R5H3_9CHLO